MIQFEIVEDTFNKKNTSVYELSILLGMDSFVYMITDAQQRIHLLAQYPYTDAQPYNPQKPQLEELERFFSKNQLLSSRYRNVRLGLQSSVFTLIPNRLFSDKDKKTILSHLSSSDHFYEARVDSIGSLNAKNVYKIFAPTANFLKQHFSAARIFNVNTTMLLAVLKIAQRSKEGYQLFYHADSRYLRAYLFEGKELIAATQNEYTSPNDFLYYALLVFEQFHLDTNSQEVFLCGLLHEDSPNYQLLYRYIKNLNYLQAPAFIQKGPKLNALPEYQFFDLFSSLLLN